MQKLGQKCAEPFFRRVFRGDYEKESFMCIETK